MITQLATVTFLAATSPLAAESMYLSSVYTQEFVCERKPIGTLVVDYAAVMVRKLQYCDLIAKYGNKELDDRRPTEIGLKTKQYDTT